MSTSDAKNPLQPTDARPHIRPLVAVDVGNSRVKLGLFSSHESSTAESPTAAVPRLATPTRMLDLVPQSDGFDQLTDWLAPHAPTDVDWWIGSVERSVSSNLLHWLRQRAADRIVLLAARDLPLVVNLPRPDMVGIDRLLAAVAANRLRPPDRPAIVVDLGTAITVDLVSRDGAFQGGAILPGIGLSARALYEFTDLLPLVEMQELTDAPAALGTSTLEAMRAGLYWGAVGGVRELIQVYATRDAAPPHIILTGGAAPSVARKLSADASYVPHLTLAGILLASQSMPRESPS